MPAIEISEETNARLQAIAKPLVDTYETVIARLLDQVSDSAGSATSKPSPLGGVIKEDGKLMEFDWRNPPSLAHTTMTRAILNGVTFVKADTNWNAVLRCVIDEAHKQGMSSDDIFNFLTVNKVKGAKTEQGFKFAKSAGISFQGQTSENAFRQIAELAAHRKFNLELMFRWQPKEEAAYPNREGVFRL